MTCIIQGFVELTERVRASMATISDKKPQNAEFVFTDQSERELIQSELQTF